MGGSNDHGTMKYPTLEKRKNRATTYGEERERATQERQRPGDNVSFYLIEREAIRLRRLRWETSAEQREFSRRVDRVATEMSGRWGPKGEDGDALTPVERLAQYARPFAAAEDTSPGLLARTSSAVSRAARNVLHRFKSSQHDTKDKGDKGGRE
jgi:hypothetical protein